MVLAYKHHGRMVLYFIWQCCAEVLQPLDTKWPTLWCAVHGTSHLEDPQQLLYRMSFITSCRWLKVEMILLNLCILTGKASDSVSHQPLLDELAPATCTVDSRLPMWVLSIITYVVVPSRLCPAATHLNWLQSWNLVLKFGVFWQNGKFLPSGGQLLFLAIELLTKIKIFIKLL